MGNVNKVLNIDDVYLRRLYKTSCRAFKLDNKFAKKGGVVFVGDSITDLCNLDTYYPGLNAANRAICGDTIDGILGRLDESIFGLAPSLVVILGGANNFQEGYNDVETFIIETYTKILSQIKSRLPDTKVLVQSVYPVSDVSYHNRYKYGHGHIVSINKKLEELTLSLGYTFADVYSILTSGDEEFDSKYTNDGLHPNPNGYRVISDFLRPMIDSLYNKDEKKKVISIGNKEKRDEITSIIEKVLVSTLLLAIGILFCLNITAAVSITLGTILCVYGIASIGIIGVGKKPLFSAMGILSAVSIAIGIAFCTHDLATVVVLLIPFILTIVGALMVIDSVFCFFRLKQGGLPRFLVFFVGGGLTFALGLTQLCIEDFRLGWSTLIFGIILCVAAFVILTFMMVGILKKKMVKEIEK